MGAALKLVTRSQPMLPPLPMPVDPVRLLPDFARMEAERCLAIIRPALNRVAGGVSVSAAAEWLASSAEGLPSSSTLARWLRDYINGGLVELAPKYSGRQRKEYGWEARALELYNRPQRPAYATVALWLRKEGFEGASEHNVRRYLKAAPSNLAETGRKRLGAHYYAQNIKPHVMRDTSKLPVGFVYEGDGHCCDVYVEHPARGHFRPELTAWIDIRSHYLVSWWISESESAHTTLFSLSQALVQHQHVPAYVHTDPGSGFKARLISHEVTGFLKRFEINPMLAIAGNAKGKGLIEGWFRWFEERCGKTFDSFCGHCRTDDDLSRLSARVKRGEIKLPSLPQYIDAIRQYIHDYNHAPQEGLGNRSPAELWQELERVELHTPAEAIVRPRKECTVQRWSIRLDNRWYRNPVLQQYEGRRVTVEYSLHHDDLVWIHDAAGRLVCEAQLNQKKDWLPASRIEEAQQRRLEGQRQRHERAIAEQEARARLPLSSVAMLGALEQDETDAALPAADLAAGHSVVARPPAQRPALSVVRPIAQEVADRVARQIEESEAPQETAEQRYQRWIDLQVAQSAGDAIAPEQLAWASTYETSSEFRAFERIRDTFGAVSGVDLPDTAFLTRS